jgi:hypothetical protein
MFGWNIPHRLLIPSQANGEWCQYIPHIVTQQQSLYEACSVSKVPTAIIFVYQAFYFVEVGTDCNRGYMQQMVQQSV